MARMVDVQPGRPLCILDPGAGTGILGAAVVQQALERGASAVELVAVEAEPGARALLGETLARVVPAAHGRVLARVVGDDFLTCASPRLGVAPLPSFDVAIANPPYFKMSPSEPHGGDAPNAYARFMEVAAAFIRPGGQLVFIVPRSFASGYYFKKFRRRFHAAMTLERVHVFDSRRHAFKDDEVLQENIVVSYRKAGRPSPGVTISASSGTADLNTPRMLTVDRPPVMRPQDAHGVVYLPSSAADVATMRAVLRWPLRLADLGLEISTGPVVPFRTDDMRPEADADTVPLLWMQHVRAGTVRWPLGATFRKEEHILRTAGDKLLVRNDTYVLIPPGNEKTRLFAWTIGRRVDSMISRKSWPSSYVCRPS